jgi:hypothetical protein
MDPASQCRQSTITTGYLVPLGKIDLQSEQPVDD